jgi:hypothetical protein
MIPDDNIPREREQFTPVRSPASHDSSLRQALQIAAAFALIKLAIQVAANLMAQHLGYGYERDELYYLICGRFLDWGYVDQPPLVALQARAVTALFGNSLVDVRMLSALAGAVKVLLTGLLAWSLGGRRTAQILAMIAVLVAPEYLGIDGYLSMNSVEPVLWMGCLLAVILVVGGHDQRWWLAAGALGGLGLQNKHSTAFFLAALLAGLIVTPQRRILLSRWFAMATALVILIALPNLIWEARHHWATYELLNNVAHSGKNVVYGPASFLNHQRQMMHPLSVLLWVPGLVWLLCAPGGRRFRFIGITYLVFLAVMMLLHSKDYYVAPIYPVLFAAGGVVWESWTQRRRWLTYAYAVILLVTGALLAPMSLPILPPEAFIRYMSAIHIKPSSTQNLEMGPFPAFTAEMFGWPELTAEVARVYDALPPAEQSKAGIFCQNYGEASAINYLGARYRLPFAISGHQNYYLWGPHGYTGEVMIVVGKPEAELEEIFSSVEAAGFVNHPYAMPFEHVTIYLCRGAKVPLASIWPQLKLWQ